MDTSKITFAHVLHAIADRSTELTRRFFELECIQPFIDNAIQECKLAAEKGYYSWRSEEVFLMDEKKEWFQTAITQAFKPLGYNVIYFYKTHKDSNNFAVLLEW